MLEDRRRRVEVHNVSKKVQQGLEPEDAQDGEAESVWNCEICGGNFSSAYNIQRHQIEKHQASSPTVASSACERVFNQSRYLKSHMRRMHTPLQTWHACTQCQNKYKDKGILTRHKKRKH